uniref:Mitochondrial folate transporter/carrier n=1 Tax=Globisporangium ultimum (strain ATCC 200006 / CBS 805.95 / DAOM BR144) TaxID=431595 RepID=K3X3X3_GLOUD
MSMTFMKDLLTQEQWKSVVQSTSGLGAGAISTALLYPLDLVKVRYQVHETSARRYRSLGHAFRTIVGEEGVRSLFRGMSPALYGSALSWGLYMYFYQNAKERYARLADTGMIQGSWQYFFSGIEAGVICVPITNPIWLIKIRMQVQSSAQLKASTASAGKDAALKLAQNVPYRGITDAFRRIVAEEGVMALYKGVVPALFLTTHGAFKFVAYETVKSVYQRHFGPEMDVIPTLAMGAISQAIASTATYPYQVIKARLQQGGASASQYSGTWDCTKKMLRNEGYVGFFKGLVPNLLKVIPTGAIVFASYEKIHSTLSAMVMD